MAASDIELMEEASREEYTRDPATLENVHVRAERLVALERELNDLAETEKKLKKERERLRIRELPEMMAELKMTSIGINNRVVAIEPLIQATLPKEPDKLVLAIEWVEDAKEGGCVKRALELDLPKGDAVMEQRVIDALLAVDPRLSPRVTPTIHHSTYTALCKRLVRAGVDLPKDLLGVFVGSIARVQED